MKILFYGKPSFIKKSLLRQNVCNKIGEFRTKLRSAIFAIKKKQGFIVADYSFPSEC